MNKIIISLKHDLPFAQQPAILSTKISSHNIKIHQEDLLHQWCIKKYNKDICFQRNSKRLLKYALIQYEIHPLITTVESCQWGFFHNCEKLNFSSKSILPAIKPCYRNGKRVVWDLISKSHLLFLKRACEMPNSQELMSQSLYHFVIQYMFRQ